jgi:hypothetical protein
MIFKPIRRETERKMSGKNREKQQKEAPKGTEKEKTQYG